MGFLFLSQKMEEILTCIVHIVSLLIVQMSANRSNILDKSGRSCHGDQSCIGYNHQVNEHCFKVILNGCEFLRTSLAICRTDLRES